MSQTPNALAPWWPEEEDVASRLQEKHPDWYRQYTAATPTDRVFWLTWLQWLEKNGRQEWIKETKKHLIREHHINAPNLEQIPLSTLLEAINRGEGPTFFEALDTRTDRWRQAALTEAHADAWQVSGEGAMRDLYTRAREQDEKECQRRAQY